MKQICLKNKSNEVVGFSLTSSKVANCTDAFEFQLVLELVYSMQTVQTEFLDQSLLVSSEFVEKEYLKLVGSGSS